MRQIFVNQLCCCVEELLDRLEMLEPVFSAAFLQIFAYKRLDIGGGAERQ